MHYHGDGHHSNSTMLLVWQVTCKALCSQSDTINQDHKSHWIHDNLKEVRGIYSGMLQIMLDHQSEQPEASISHITSTVMTLKMILIA